MFAALAAQARTLQQTEAALGEKRWSRLTPSTHHHLADWTIWSGFVNIDRVAPPVVKHTLTMITAYGA